MGTFLCSALARAMAVVDLTFFAFLAVVAIRFALSLLRYCRNGIPMARSSATPSASVRALVVIEMFMPLVFSTLA